MEGYDYHENNPQEFRQPRTVYINEVFAKFKNATVYGIEDQDISSMMDLLGYFISISKNYDTTLDLFPEIYNNFLIICWKNLKIVKQIFKDVVTPENIVMLQAISDIIENYTPYIPGTSLQLHYTVKLPQVIAVAGYQPIPMKLVYDIIYDFIISLWQQSASLQSTIYLLKIFIRIVKSGDVNELVKFERRIAITVRNEKFAENINKILDVVSKPVHVIVGAAHLSVSKTWILMAKPPSNIYLDEILPGSIAEDNVHEYYLEGLLAVMGSTI